MKAASREPYDPTTDPEEQNLILSVLDSFRYAHTCLTKMTPEDKWLTSPQLLPPPCSLQWDTPAPPSLLFPPTIALDTAIPPALLYHVYALSNRRPD